MKAQKLHEKKENDTEDANSVLGWTKGICLLHTYVLNIIVPKSVQLIGHCNVGAWYYANSSWAGALLNHPRMWAYLRACLYTQERSTRDSKGCSVVSVRKEEASEEEMSGEGLGGKR